MLQLRLRDVRLRRAAVTLLVALTRRQRRHALLLLAAVAEPDAHHLLFQLQGASQAADLWRRRLRLLQEMLLQQRLHRYLDAGALLTFPPLRRHPVDGGREPGRRVGLLQPLLQQRLQLAHVLEAELQRLKAANSRLAEHVAVERAERQTDVGLREAQLDAALFELFGERLEVVGGGLFGRLVAGLTVRRQQLVLGLPAQVRRVQLVRRHAVHAAVDVVLTGGRAARRRAQVRRRYR